MPNIKSAAKRLRQDEKRRLRNKMKKSTMRTWIRRLNEAVQAGDQAKAKELLPAVFKRIDKAANARCIHKNTAARKKSLVERRVNAMAR